MLQPKVRGYREVQKRKKLSDRADVFLIALKAYIYFIVYYITGKKFYYNLTILVIIEKVDLFFLLYGGKYGGNLVIYLVSLEKF